MESMTSIATALAAAATLGLCACASKPQYQWSVAASRTSHIPLQGLPALPRTVSAAVPAVLVNFGDRHEREAERANANARNAAANPVNSAGYTMLALGPVCVLLPPACIGIAGAAAAAATYSNYIPGVSQQQADGLAGIARREGNSGKLESWVERRLGEESGEFPTLVVKPATVILLTSRDGVAFRVIAQAQAFVSSTESWEPSIHVTQLPWRPVDDWLQSGGKNLSNDLNFAFAVLAGDIARVYMPYRERGK